MLSSYRSTLHHHRDRSWLNIVTAGILFASLMSTTQFVSSEDAAAANALRLEALEELNAGEAETAMALLRSALALNSNNPNIAADLAKVERIQAALTKSR